jgi:hypothetical protein
MPSSYLARALTPLRHVGGETFREARDDGTLGAKMTFRRNADLRVAGYVTWIEFGPKLSP